MAVALLTPMAAACFDPSALGSSPPSSAPSARANAVHGPMFPECGGVSDQTVSQLTHLPTLVTTHNAVGCQWLTRRGVHGPWIFFTWYRGSPIGRERKGDELTRTRVDDITIDGHTGWIAVHTDPALGDNMCTVAIQYQDDFIEWSIAFSERPFPDSCAIVKELTGQSIGAAN